MRNLFLLLWRNNFTLLFLLLWSVCFYLVFRNNNFQQTSAFNSANKVAGSVLETVNTVKEYLYLRENNESLARENSKLKGMLPESRYEHDSSDVTVTDTLLHQQYTYMSARVVNNSVNRRNNYLTLNRGSLHGVKKDMGVISSSGVVGIVKDVSDHYCTVMSVLHKNTSISTRFKKNNYFGSLVWNGGDPSVATLKEVAKHVKFSKGDTLVTTVYSLVFPEGVMVGVVKDWEVKAGDNFYTINVKLSTSLANLSHVYIVDNLMKKEQKELEALTRSKDKDDN
jgi:rod shape-determining protein MreC